MKYMGSKSRIAKFIVPILQDIINTNNIEIYYEPFVGGCNVIDKIECKVRIGNDKNPYLIELLKAHQQGMLKELPLHISKEHYDEVRSEYNRFKDNINESKISGRYDLWYIGAVGFLASYNGRFFDGGYSGVITEKTGRKRDFYDEAKRNLSEQKLDGIELRNHDYRKLDIGDKKALVYCDPPYKGTKQYNYSKDFDYELFWNWVRDMSKKYVVIVSEQNAPEDFNIIWEQPITRSIGNRTLDSVKNKDVTEKLFSLNSIKVKEN